MFLILTNSLYFILILLLILTEILTKIPPHNTLMLNYCVISNLFSKHRSVSNPLMLIQSKS